MSIKIFYDEINYRLGKAGDVRRLVEKVINDNNKIVGDLNFILTTDNSLRKINNEFLEHDYYTDVITFNYSNDNLINGEVYISIDTVRENSLNYKDSLRMELIRVMVHGVLHLLEYDDKTTAERNQMRILENKWLQYFKEMK